MRILAIDTALARCSVAALDDSGVIGFDSRDLPRGHAEALMPMIERVAAAAGLALDRFDRLAVTIGPGHFTGLRAGLAAARGLALATGLPLIGVTTLAVVAAGIPAAERREATLVVALDSKRAEPYLQTFDHAGRPRGAPLSAPLDGLTTALDLDGPVELAGDAAAAVAAALAAGGIATRLVAADPLPDVRVLARLARTTAPGDRPPGPLYLHPPAVRLPA